MSKLIEKEFVRRLKSAINLLRNARQRTYAFKCVRPVRRGDYSFDDLDFLRSDVSTLESIIGRKPNPTVLESELASQVMIIYARTFFGPSTKGVVASFAVSAMQGEETDCQA